MRIRSGRARWWMLVASLLVTVPIFGVAKSASATDAPPLLAQFELEMDVSGNGGNMNIGEPEIAVNPVNPKQLYVDGAIFPVPLIFNGPSPVPYTCGGWSSENGGLSWQVAFLPVSICEDGVAVFGPDGTLYAGGDSATSTAVVPCSTPGSLMFGPVCILVQGYDPVLHSTDGGHTWSAPVKVMGSTNLASFPFAPGSGNPLNTFDRPWLAVDQSTNTLYAIGHNIADHEGFVTASTDEAQSFGTIYAIDSPAYPSGGLFGGHIAAAHGVLAVVYGATQAPQATCPCVIFETTTDHGATFTRHVVPTVNASSQPFPFVAASPTEKGHYALTVFDASGTENQVYTTGDSGKTWHGPTVVGEAPPNQRFKPWLTYGQSGQLFLVWRTWNGSPNTSPYDVWLAIGRNKGDRGAVFGPPTRVSSASAPYPAGYTAGDDFSFVIATDKYVRVGWGDSRDVAFGAGVQIWIATIPLETAEEVHD